MGSGQVIKYLEWDGIFVKLAQCTAIDERGATFISASSISPLPQFRFCFDLDRTGMQDVREILGGGGASGGVGSGGRIFGDRRMRAAPHGHHHQQALKCPRCDSLNTKFCYYNNYNLSQPRHFCKNCRRYWTKGGVLRNVPVGGGCRKSKRSKRKPTSDSPSQPLSIAAKDRHLSNSGSSSESTSANAAKADIGFSGKAIGVPKAVSEAGSDYSSSPLFSFSEQPPASFNSLATTPVALNSNFKGGAGIQGSNSGNGGVFTEAGRFVSLMNGDQNQNMLGFTNSETTPFGMHQQSQVNNQLLLQNLSSRDWQKEKMDGVDNWGQGVFDQTVHVDLLSNDRTGDGVLAGGNWHGVPGGGGVGDGGGHLGMFDLTPGSDWSQSSQWHESDHHLYLPP